MKATLARPKRRENLISIPDKEYREFLVFKSFIEFTPNASEKKALLNAERNFRTGKTISYNELRAKLGFAN